jgi:hypothetical protein
MLKFELVVLGQDDVVVLQTLLFNCDERDHESWIKEEAERTIDKFINREYISISRWYVKKVDVIIDQIY